MSLALVDISPPNRTLVFTAQAKVLACLAERLSLVTLLASKAASEASCREVKVSNERWGVIGMLEELVPVRERRWVFVLIFGAFGCIVEDWLKIVGG